MLGKPVPGWSTFKLKDTNSYDLSYLSDIPYEWVEAAICGLQMDMPFCVKGHTEPGLVTCTVSCDNCHIVFKAHPRLYQETSNTTRLQFCQSLYDDISQNIDIWVEFHSHKLDDSERRTRKKDLEQKLARLKDLISK